MYHCDPRHHLKFDTVSAFSEADLAYAFFSEVDDETAERFGRDANSTFYIEGLPVGVSFSDAKEILRHYKSRTGKALSKKESSSLLEQKLSGNALSAYINCLRGASPLVVQASIPKDKTESARIVFSVNWDPRSISANGNLEVKIVGGTLEHGDTTYTQALFPRGKTKDFVVKRTNDDTIYFTAEIDGESVTKEIPPDSLMEKPEMVIREIHLSVIYRGEFYGPQGFQETVSIQAEPGTVLIPSTANLEVRKNYGRPDAVPQDLVAEIRERSSSIVNFYYHNNHGSNPGVSSIAARGTVWQVRL